MLASLKAPNPSSYGFISTGELGSPGEIICSAACLADIDCKGVEYVPTETVEDCQFFPLEVDFTDLLADSETIIIKECGKFITRRTDIRYNY